MSRFLITCGGTGGHLSPGISLAEGLQARGHETVLLISRKAVDTRLAGKYPHLRFERMPGTGLSWRPAGLARFAVSQTQAVLFCLRLMRRFRPESIVGFGGFTSAPVMLAAGVLGIPSALHESNRVPGRAVRTLGRFADRLYLPPGIRLPGIGNAVVRHVGLPVRSEIVRVPAGTARAALGFDPDRPLLVLLGGSQGATALNQWARSAAPELAAAGTQLCVVTGLGKGQEETLAHPGPAGRPVTARFLAFSDRMAELMSAADLVVSRAGAGTLAELIRCETPAVLVPYPQAADDHQRANADYFAREGGGTVVPQTELDRLLPQVLALLRHGAALRIHRENLRRMDRANSLELMLVDLEHLARRPRPGRGEGTLVIA